MNVAITGGNGFIGSHLSKMINDLGHKVIFISRTKQNVSNKMHFSFEDFFQLKINMNIDCFIHLASPNYDFASDNSLEEGITLLTSNILEVLSKYNCEKLIFFSSAKIYGEPSLMRKNIFHEDSKPEPVSDYGKQKLRAEKKIIEHANNTKLDYLIYRMPMVYGPSNNSNINKLLEFIEKSYPFILFKNMNHLKKSLVSIENIKLYVKHNLQNPDTIKSNIFNITDKKSVCLNEFINVHKKKTNSNSLIITLPYLFLTIFSKIPFLGNYFIKLYGQFEISNKNIRNAYKIECLDTYNCIVQKNHE